MADGFKYEGDWLNGEIHGAGIATYTNGDVYEGNFQSGRRQGQGTMRYASGVVASGNWVEGELEQDSATITPAPTE